MHVRIKALKDLAQKALDDQNAILAAADASADKVMTDAQKVAYDAAVKAFDKAMADIVPLQEVVTRTASLGAVVVPSAAPAAPVDDTGVIDRVARGLGADPAVPAIPKGPDDWKIKMGCYAWATAKAKVEPQRTGYQHLADFGLQQLVDEAKAANVATVKSLQNILGSSNPVVVRAITTLTGGAADNMVNTPLASEFIEFLRANSAFMAGNPSQIDMPFGSLEISGGLAGATGTYHAQNSDIGYTQATTRKVALSAKHIAAITAFGNYALEVSPLAIASIMGDDLVNGIAQGIDLAGLRGDGTGMNPNGLLTLTHVSHVTAATATTVAPTVAQIDADAKAMITKLDVSQIQKRRPQWIMPSRVFRYMQFMRDGVQGYVYPSLHAAKPTWLGGFPVIVSDLLPTNLGVGTNETELYLVDFGHVIMGVTRSLRMKASTEASYKNAGGTLVSAFNLDETVVRGMASHDFDMRHTKAAVILTAVRWGA